MRTKLICSLAVIVAAAGLVACGDDGESTTEEANGGGAAAPPAQTTAPAPEKQKPAGPAIETIVVRNGAPVGGVSELEYDAGDRIRFRVRSDVADEVHVHGYDVSRRVPAGGQVVLSFPADIEGVFEVELEERGEQIAELRVNP